jgi:autotransporter-associated beta strand protein
MLSGESGELLHTAFISSVGIAPFASSTPTGLAPQQVRRAYGFDQIAFGGVQGDGSGQTIAIIDPYDSPTIIDDLHAFDAQFGLPDPPSFLRVAQDGSTNYPVTDPNGPGHLPTTWEVETALDVEWAHALAPLANLLLVEANGTSPSDLLTAAVNYARNQPGVSVVTMSFGRSEIPAEVSYDSLFATPSGHIGVTFLAATGDSGQPAAYPAYSPAVIAVGGTSLSVDDQGNYQGESGWSGSGGGISTVEPQPAFQSGTATPFSGTMRTAPDVAFDAASGVAVYDSWDFGVSTPWVSVGGTSLASPAWGALIAIADQARVAAGMPTLDGPTQTLPTLYAMPSADFRDITTGNNGYSAGPGYDLVAGRGSPKAPLIVSDLVGGVASSVPAASASVSTRPTDFAITFASAYDPTSIQVGDLAVNGQMPDSFKLSSATTVTFHFNTSPVIAQGLQTMSIPAGAVTWLSNGAPLTAFSASFRYDALPLAVTSVTPASGSTVTLPLTTVTLQFNEAYAPSSISTSNLSLNQGSVSGYTLVDSQTVSYQLTGVTSAGTLTIAMASGAVTDTFGNPGPGFSGSLILNYPAIPFPTPLSSVLPAGSLIYQNSTSGTIAAGSTDTYSLPAAAGQTLTILVTTRSGLQSQLKLIGPGVTASASSPLAGAPAVLQSIPVNTTGTFALSVSGLNGTIGSYTVQVVLDASLSSVTVSGPGNHSVATAQNIDPSFIALSNAAQRGAVAGTFANLIGPDGSGYSAASIAPQFVDISPTGPAPTPNAPLLVGVDDGTAALTAANLSGFTFSFYNTTYTSLYISSNGLLTFGTGNSAYANTDLTSAPGQAAIAPLWDDLVVGGGTQSGIFWQVQGTGANQRLVVQFNDVGFAGGAYTGSVTFEVLLNANGTIVFNYKNLDSGDAHSGGASATVGIKDAGLQGNNRLLVSYNSAANALVANGRSVEIGTSLASFTSDYYAYSLAAGQSTTLAVTGQNLANMNLTLLNSQGQTLAAGTSPGAGSNVGSLIQNYVAPAAGTYYAVTTGPGGTAYSLVATRGAAFDTELNGSFSTAQDIDGTSGVLGWMLAAPATPTANWYSINVAAGNELLLLTSTPGSVGSPFANGLVPRIELYSPSSALVASGQGAGNQSLAALASVSGAYRVRVWGNNSTSGVYFLSAAVDTAPPSATITPVTPSPRNTPVDQVQIVFNEPVTGLTLADFSLAVTGGPNRLTPAQTLTTSDNTVYTLGNLGAVTNSVGTYSLTLAADANVADSNGGFLTSGANTSFVVNVPVVVTATADSGLGSLRQALLDMAGAPGLTHTIDFELPAGSQVIDLLSPLPAVADPLVAALDTTQHVIITASSGAAWDEFHAVTKNGNGTLTLGATGRFDGDIAVAGGMLTLQAGTTPSFTTGVRANTSGDGTLELAGLVSALTPNVNIVNNSTAPSGVVASGANQAAGIVSGMGNLAVIADGDLTVSRIEQTALVISGTVGHPARLTIATSLNLGNELSMVATAGPITQTSVNQQGTGFILDGLRQGVPTGDDPLNLTRSNDSASESGTPATSLMMKPSTSLPVRRLPIDIAELGLVRVTISTGELVGRSPQPIVYLHIFSSSDSPTLYAKTPSQLGSRGVRRLELFQFSRAVARATGRRSHDYVLAHDDHSSPRVAAILEEFSALEGWQARERLGK